jgi:hypothetical protein
VLTTGALLTTGDALTADFGATSGFATEGFKADFSEDVTISGREDDTVDAALDAAIGAALDAAIGAADTTLEREEGATTAGRDVSLFSSFVSFPLNGSFVGTVMPNILLFIESYLIFFLNASIATRNI